MSENPNNKNDQDEFDISKIIEEQKTTENKSLDEGTVRPSSTLKIDPDNPYLKNGNSSHEHHHHHHHRHHHKRRSRWQMITWIILAVMLAAGCAVLVMLHQLPGKYREIGIFCLVVFAVLTALYSFRKYHHKGRRTVVIANTILIALFVMIGAAGAVAYKQVKSVMPQAVALKNDLSTVMDDIRKEDTDGASTALTAVNNDNQALKETMNTPVWKAAEKIPALGSQVKSVNTVTDVVDEASAKVISPLLNQMKNQPLSQLKVGDDGFNVSLINSYLDFMDQVKPSLTDINQKIQNIDLSLTGQQDSIDQYKTTFESLIKGSDKYIPVFRMILGNGNDRKYLFMAQNLAEGRANGGFPGSASIITISNGVLNIGDFESIKNIIPDNSPEPVDVASTPEEDELFDRKMSLNWDANYTPDFSRAGQIWSRAYEDQNGDAVNGVISLTPSVIQDALNVFNTTITLSDGTVLNGENTAKVLGYDMYYKYLGHDADVNGTISEGDDITDSLFSETASKAKSILVDNFSVGNLQEYVQLLDKTISDGTFLAWMKDPNEENTAINAGISGILTDGKTQNGETGFYWSFDSGCKMGWFMDLDSEISEPVTNNDETSTYTVTVSMKNLFTDADRDNGSGYILGNYNGTLQGQLHIIAPLGGKISNVKVENDNDTPMTEGTYEGLQVFYNNITVVPEGKTMKVTYQVTLPEGVKNLILRMTPSYTNYRK